jgi:hypothetical protein
MFEPDMKPTERKLIVLLFILILGSLAFITYRNLQARTPRSELAPPSLSERMATLPSVFSHPLQ